MIAERHPLVRQGQSEESPRPVIVLDNNCRILAQNEAARRVLGECIGHRCARAEGCVRGLSCQIKHFELDGRLSGGGGNGTQYSLSHSVLYQRGGTRWMVALEQAPGTGRPDEPNDLDVLSHELLSPLGTLQGYAATLREMRGHLSLEEEERYLLAMERLSRRVTRLAHNVLDGRRLYEGRFDVVARPVSLTSLVKSVTMEMRDEAPHHTFNVLLPHAMPKYCLDEAKIKLLLANLIENAIKYSPDGGAIDVALRQVNRSEDLPRYPLNHGAPISPQPFAVVTVRDEGVGMSAEESSKLFEPFQRLHNGAPSIPGVGLGLYLCKAIVQAHHGWIWAESRPGEGSTFSFVLPRNGASDDRI